MVQTNRTATFDKKTLSENCCILKPLTKKKINSKSSKEIFRPDLIEVHIKGKKLIKQFEIEGILTQQ